MAKSLEQVLVDRGLISAEQLDHATAESRQQHEPLARTLIREQLIAEDELLKILADQQGLDFTTLRDMSVDAAAIGSLTARFVSHYAVVPVRLKGSILTVATSNPFDMSSVEDIETNHGYSVERVFACGDDIAEAIKKYYGVGADTVERILDDLGDPGEIKIERQSQDLEKMAEDASVVKLVNQLLQEAIRDRATDIHFEIYNDGVIVRRRIDGVLYDTKVAENIGVLYPAIVSRVKLMAGLNIVERRLPQDGRIRVTVGHSQYDLRVSVVPALHGENVVIRILPTTMLLSLEDLGLSPAHMKQLRELSEQPHGIIMVTGPTGSGKSTTLYACLSMLNGRERKIVTIEDPVEYEIRGLCQTQINPGIGLTFATALRSMLRHDPDVMMVGEVRDRETAEITIQTALTGHLVFSTLHTNDAASGAVRLIDMGVDPYLVASSVRAFTAQRLVRVICSSCRESFEEDGKTVYHGKGCKKCVRTGFKGRAAICEILPLSAEIQKLILNRASADELRDKAIELGMTTLEQDGWEKVSQGITTAEEVLKVASM